MIIIIVIITVTIVLDFDECSLLGITDIPQNSNNTIIRLLTIAK